MPNWLVVIILVLPLAIAVMALVVRSRYGWRGAPSSLKLKLFLAWAVALVPLWLPGEKGGNQTLMPETTDYWLCAGLVALISFMVITFFMFEKNPNPPSKYKPPR